MLTSVFETLVKV